MKKTIYYDRRKRLYLKKKEFSQLFKKLLIKNTKIHFKEKFISINQEIDLTFYSELNNLCVISGRARSVYKFFGLSRIMLRSLGSNGLISGLKKHSW